MIQIIDNSISNGKFSNQIRFIHFTKVIGYQLFTRSLVAKTNSSWSKKHDFSQSRIEDIIINIVVSLFSSGMLPQTKTF